MKRFIFAIAAIISFLLSACGGQTAAEPTVSAGDIQATAVAAAFTIVAETQAAIPTNTPLPPTETPSPTPLPTDTPLPTATIDPLVFPTATAVQQSSGNTDPCNAPLPGSIEGHPTKIKIWNHTNINKVRVSLYLNKTPFGECGFATVPALGKNDSQTFYNLVQGSYYLYAWTDDGKINASASGFINNPDLWTFEIRENNILFYGP